MDNLKPAFVQANEEGDEGEGSGGEEVQSVEDSLREAIRKIDHLPSLVYVHSPAGAAGCRQRYLRNAQTVYRQYYYNTQAINQLVSGSVNFGY